MKKQRQAYKQHHGKKAKVHEVKRKKLGSGKDGRSGSTKLERKLEEETM